MTDRARERDVVFGGLIVVAFIMAAKPIIAATAADNVAFAYSCHHLLLLYCAF